MDINREKFIDLSARLPYGVRGTVPVEVATGEYDIIDGSMWYDEKEILVELLGIGDGGEIEVLILEDGWEDYDLSDYDFTLDDFTPYLRPMESIPDDVRKEMCDNMYKIDMDILRKRMDGDNILDVTGNIYCVNFLLSRHYDINGLIPKKLANAVTPKNNPYEKN